MARTTLPLADRLAVSIPDAAALLDVSERSIYRAIALGQLPTMTVGTLQRIPRKALERLADGTDAPPAWLSGSRTRKGRKPA